MKLYLSSVAAVVLRQVPPPLRSLEPANTVISFGTTGPSVNYKKHLEWSLGGLGEVRVLNHVGLGFVEAPANDADELEGRLRKLDFVDFVETEQSILDLDNNVNDDSLEGSVESTPSRQLIWTDEEDDWCLKSINLAQAWFYTRGASQRVMQVEFGIHEHPELQGQFWINKREVQDGLDNDGNHYVDDISGINLNLGNGDIGVGGYQWHGTMVAGHMLARQDAYGVVGVAPDAKLVFCNISDRLHEVALCVDYAVSSGVRVLNGSFYVTGSSAAVWIRLLDALQAHNILWVVASGNQGRELTDAEDLWPMRLKHPALFVVGAHDRHERKPYFSNYSSAKVQISAPGVGCRALSKPPAWYKYSNGSSVSAPLTTACVALMLSLKPDMPLGEVTSILQETARPWCSTCPQWSESGLLDCGAAVAKTKSLSCLEAGIDYYGNDLTRHRVHVLYAQDYAYVVMELLAEVL
ncbi:MAG: uncharacterized protein KVP18_001613 [Porospora cf. gigantea A]|uniref:uncharacterized protein n=1 Tax=Porospora cf. gigantea A TaxID=2853593 RepID=UPI00355A4D9F|nr:MAG: hypothetical protein KVP18_001613 [Porospora cf. gigantea A]